METKKSEYQQLKALGLSDRDITMLRNTGAAHGAILEYARRKAEKDLR